MWDAETAQIAPSTGSTPTPASTDPLRSRRWEPPAHHGPRTDLDAVARTAAAHQGSVTTSQLARHPRRAVRAAVDAGVLVRVGRGRFVLPSSPDALRQALVHRGVVSHESVARLWFLEPSASPGAGT